VLGAAEADCEIVSSYGLLVVVACKSRMEGADTHVMSGFRRKSEGRERRKHDLCVVV
jgi:hypothetical protein